LRFFEIASEVPPTLGRGVTPVHPSEERIEANRTERSTVAGDFSRVPRHVDHSVAEDDVLDRVGRGAPVGHGRDRRDKSGSGDPELPRADPDHPLHEPSGGLLRVDEDDEVPDGGQPFVEGARVHEQPVARP